MQYKFWIYIMASPSGTLHIGVTDDLFLRVHQHKNKEIEGFTKQYNCIRLVYYESFDQVRLAIAREKQLKGWRRSKKIALIEKVNPQRMDLSEKWGAEMRFPGQAIQERTP